MIIIVKWSRPSDTSHRCSQGLPILLVKSELKTEPTLTPNQPNLEPTLTPNQPNCSEEPGGSNNYYLTHLYLINIQVSKWLHESAPAAYMFSRGGRPWDRDIFVESSNPLYNFDPNDDQVLIDAPSTPPPPRNNFFFVGPMGLLLEIVFAQLTAQEPVLMM